MADKELLADCSRQSPSEGGERCRGSALKLTFAWLSRREGRRKTRTIHAPTGRNRVRARRLPSFAVQGCLLALLLFASAGGRPSPIQDSARVLVGLLALAVLCVWATSRRYVLVAFLEGAAIGKREITVLRLRRRIYFHGAKVDKSHQEVGVLSALTCEALRELEMRHPRYRLHVVAPVHDSTRRISKIIDGSTVQEARRRWESRAPVNAS